MTTTRPKRGRPSKFNRPSRVVALTLPHDVIGGLRKVDVDLARAIVSLFEKDGKPKKGRGALHRDVELVAIPDRKLLIVVNMAVVRRLPGIHVIPLNGDRAFLALESGRGVSDLELAILDRLEEGAIERREHDALVRFRAELRRWRRDPGLTFEQRAIIVATRVDRRRAK
jgi:hypothetical protein